MKRNLFIALILAALMTGCGAPATHTEGDGHDHSKDTPAKTATPAKKDDHAHTEGDGHDHAKDGAKHKDEHAHTEGDGHDHSKDEPAKKEEKGK